MAPPPSCLQDTCPCTELQVHTCALCHVSPGHTRRCTDSTRPTRPRLDTFCLYTLWPLSPLPDTPPRLCTSAVVSVCPPHMSRCRCSTAPTLSTLDTGCCCNSQTPRLARSTGRCTPAPRPPRSASPCSSCRRRMSRNTLTTGTRGRSLGSSAHYTRPSRLTHPRSRTCCCPPCRSRADNLSVAPSDPRRRWRCTLSTVSTLTMLDTPQCYNPQSPRLLPHIEALRISDQAAHMSEPLFSFLRHKSWCTVSKVSTRSSLDTPLCYNPRSPQTPLHIDIPLT